MNNRSLVTGGIILLFVVLGGGFLLLRNQGVAPQPTETNLTTSPSPTKTSQGINPSPSETSTIQYTSGGFEPKTITLKAGTTVMWVNKDTDPMLITSNPHPTHTDLPELNAKTNTPPGGVYSFTFTKKGTWGYHNHLEPSNTGTVVVE